MQLASRLREAILRGELRPGRRLVERSLAETTGTSQASVRDALHVLEQEGLVTKRTNTATFVTELSAARLREIVNVRLQLEPYAAWLASQRLTDDDAAALSALVESIGQHAVHQDLYLCSREDFAFHQRIWRCSGNGTLSRMLTQICTAYFAYTSILPGLCDEELDERFGSHDTVVQRWRDGLTERYDKHRELMETLIHRDRRQIEAAFREHVTEGWRWLLDDDAGTPPRRPTRRKPR